MPQDENKLVGLYCTNCNELTPQFPQTIGFCCQACCTTNWLSEGSMYQEISKEWIDNFWKFRPHAPIYKLFVGQGQVREQPMANFAPGRSLILEFPINAEIKIRSNLESSVNVLIHHLKTDPDLWHSYKSNIAMAFYDSYQEFYNHEQYADIVKPRKLKNSTILGIADDAAENFLTLFTSK